MGRDRDHARPRHARRQRGGGIGRVPPERGDRHLPDHPQFADGGALRRMGESGQDQSLGRGPGDRRDAVGGGRCRRGARRAAGGSAGHDLHGVPGPAPHDPQHVQDRGRADALHDARGGAHAGHARLVDLRRSLGRDGLPPDRLRAALLQLGAGGARPGGHRPRRDPRIARAVPALLRRLPHLARDREDRGAQRRRPAQPGIPEPAVEATGRARSRPTDPVLRGTAQNPDVFFQAREAANLFYDACPGHRRAGDGRVRRRGPAAATACSTTRAIPRPSA